MGKAPAISSGAFFMSISFMSISQAGGDERNKNAAPETGAAFSKVPAGTQNGTRNRYLRTGRRTPRPRRCGGPEHHGVTDRFRAPKARTFNIGENHRKINDFLRRGPL
jgi:hypothetical protein